MVIPFKDTDVPNGLISTLNSVLDHFFQELATMFDKHEEVALYESCWKSAERMSCYQHCEPEQSDPYQGLHWFSLTLRFQC